MNMVYFDISNLGRDKVIITTMRYRVCWAKRSRKFDLLWAKVNRGAITQPRWHDLNVEMVRGKTKKAKLWRKRQTKSLLKVMDNAIEKAVDGTEALAYAMKKFLKG